MQPDLLGVCRSGGGEKREKRRERKTKTKVEMWNNGLSWVAYQIQAWWPVPDKPGNGSFSVWIIRLNPSSWLTFLFPWD